MRKTTPNTRDSHPYQSRKSRLTCYSNIIEPALAILTVEREFHSTEISRFFDGEIQIEERFSPVGHSLAIYAVRDKNTYDAKTGQYKSKKVPVCVFIAQISTPEDPNIVVYHTDPSWEQHLFAIYSDLKQRQAEILSKSHQSEQERLASARAANTRSFLSLTEYEALVEQEEKEKLEKWHQESVATQAASTASATPSTPVDTAVEDDEPISVNDHYWPVDE